MKDIISLPNSMSYDIILFNLPEGQTASEFYESGLEAGESALSPEAFELQKAKLTERLIEANPDWEEFATDDYLELTSEDSGVQITIFPNEISVSLPYWHEGEEAQQAFEEIFGYLAILEDETDYAIYDPQMDAEIDVAQGSDAFLQLYLGVSENMETLMEEDKPAETRTETASADYIGIGIVIVVSMAIVVVFLRNRMYKNEDVA